MKKWLCIVCGWIYDESKGWPDDGIVAGTRWEDVPDDWVCPECGVGKADFEMIEITDEEEVSLDNSMLNTPSVSIESILSDSEIQNHSTKPNANFKILSVSDLTPNKEETPQNPIVIIGSGYAGYQLAESLRKSSSDIAITIFTKDDGELYSKPALSNALALNKNTDDLIRESALAIEKRLNIRIYTNTQVLSIDRANKQITTNIGNYEYSQLVLATGANPINVPIDGDTKDIMQINNLSDYRHFRNTTINAKHITILGDGLIGCEFANDLAASGKNITVVGLGTWAMQRLIPQSLGESLQQALGSLGVEWKLENSIVHVQKNLDDYTITLKNGEKINTDAIISAVGLRPNIQLAQQAGLDTGIGIKTDLSHRTSDSHIFALGDCAEVAGRWQPYINPISQAIAPLTKTLLGNQSDVMFKPTAIMVKTPIMPLSFFISQSDGEWQTQEIDGGLVASLTTSAGNLIGFALMGESAQKQRQSWIEKFI